MTGPAGPARVSGAAASGSPFVTAVEIELDRVGFRPHKLRSGALLLRTLSA